MTRPGASNISKSETRDQEPCELSTTITSWEGKKLTKEKSNEIKLKKIFKQFKQLRQQKGSFKLMRLHHHYVLSASRRIFSVLLCSSSLPIFSGHLPWPSSLCSRRELLKQELLIGTLGKPRRIRSRPDLNELQILNFRRHLGQKVLARNSPKKKKSFQISFQIY